MTKMLFDQIITLHSYDSVSGERFRTLCASGFLTGKLTESIDSCMSCRLPGPEFIKPFPCSTQLSMKFILLINVKMQTIVGIFTFISMINTTSEKPKARNFFTCRYFSFMRS